MAVGCNVVAIKTTSDASGNKVETVVTGGSPTLAAYIATQAAAGYVLSPFRREDLVVFYAIADLNA